MPPGSRVRVGGDDRRAEFEAVALPLLPALLGRARWLTGSRADAEDLVQETYLRAFAGFRGFAQSGWETLARELDHLPACHRAAVVLRFVEDMSYRDIVVSVCRWARSCRGSAVADASCGTPSAKVDACGPPRSPKGPPQLELAVAPHLRSRERKVPVGLREPVSPHGSPYGRPLGHAAFRAGPAFST